MPALDDAAAEALYDELVGGPDRACDAAEQRLRRAAQAQCAALSLGCVEHTGSVEAAVANAEAALDQARSLRDLRERHWNLMRATVFGMTEERVRARSRLLAARGCSDEEIAAFLRAGQRAITGEQLERLAAAIPRAKPR